MTASTRNPQLETRNLLAELETQIQISEELGFLNNGGLKDAIFEKVARLRAMLITLGRKL